MNNEKTRFILLIMFYIVNFKHNSHFVVFSNVKWIIVSQFSMYLLHVVICFHHFSKVIRGSLCRNSKFFQLWQCLNNSHLWLLVACEIRTMFNAKKFTEKREIPYMFQVWLKQHTKNQLNSQHHFPFEVVLINIGEIFHFLLISFFKITCNIQSF